MTPILVLDAHYLCHRAFHTTQGLSWKDKPTGVLFGFLQSIGHLKDDFQTDRIMFCFEHKHLKRRDIFPAYKEKRMHAERPPEEVRAMGEFAVQIAELQHRYLPKIGFRNVFAYDGYESDDTMAAIAQHYSATDDVVIVTSDQDLLQCLSPRVSIYSPQKRKLFTEHWFWHEYKIHPWQWELVKAIGGCSGDGVPGIKGVGEKTALKFVQGALPRKSKAYTQITSEQGRAIVRRNRQLVGLPFDGCPVPKLVDDEITNNKWQEVVAELGFSSLAGKPPLSTRKLLRYGEQGL
jgi:5'-3' exonuclease